MRLARAIVVAALLAAASLGPSAAAKDDTPDAINALMHQPSEPEPTP